MLAHFLAPHPRFGRVNNRLPVGHQQRSPYYWWWACLRRNTDYLACCAAGGAGALAALYADFGDVREDNFHRWWSEHERGRMLFAEQPLAVKFAELASAQEWSEQWTAQDVIVVAVPLRVSKRSLMGSFARLLNARHTGKQGRPALAQQQSTARYPVARNYTVANLRIALAVYDLWVANQNRSADQQLTLWQMGCELNLNKQAARDAVSTHKADRAVGRNVLAATVSRHVRQARLLIAGTAEGVFPAA